MSGQLCAWEVVVPGQLSYLGDCLPGQLCATAVVTWAVVLAPKRALYLHQFNFKGPAKSDFQIAKF